MAWEWVAPVSAASGAIVGIIATYLTGKNGQAHAADITNSTNRQNAAIEREKRAATALSDAVYFMLLTESALFDRQVYADVDKIHHCRSQLYTHVPSHLHRRYDVWAESVGYAYRMASSASDEEWTKIVNGVKDDMSVFIRAANWFVQQPELGEAPSWNPARRRD